MKEKDSEQKTNKMGFVYPKVTSWDVMKEYWRLMQPYKWFGFFVFIGVAISTLSQSVLAPVLYKKFFDVISQSPMGDPSTTSLLIGTVIAILILNAISWIFSRGAIFSLSYFEASVVRVSMQHAFDYLLEHSHSFFTNHFTGSLVQKNNRFGRSFIRIADKFTMDIAPLIIKITGAIVILYIIQPLIAYGIFLWIALFIVTSYFFARYKIKYDVLSAQLDSKTSGQMSDSISNHSSTQLFSATAHESMRLNAIIKDSAKVTLFRWNLQNTIEAIHILLAISIEFVVFYFGIKYWNQGLMSIGTFALLQAYILTIGSSLWGFSRIVRDLYESFSDAKEMVEILHLEHEIKDMPNAKEMNVEKGAIEFRNVTFAFGKNKPVLDGINISIKPGEKVAFIGSSGAGKSTLVKLLLRLHDIQKGEILVDDQDVKLVTQKSLRENISLVPQDPALFHRTLMENIRYGRRNATDDEVRHAAKLAHCDEFIDELPQKYETYVGERGVKLSGGERQRVAIARAILKNAPVLVLDEATSSLDSHSESLIQDALHTLMEGKTTIVIAHRLSTIRKMDRIIVVSKGRVVEEGSHDQLIQKPGGIYAKLWSLQAGGFADKSIEELLES